MDWKLLHYPVEAETGKQNENAFFIVNIKEDPSEKSNIEDRHLKT
jgi:hypothetical protein